jgi:hypothetical protein
LSNRVRISIASLTAKPPKRIIAESGCQGVWLPERPSLQLLADDPNQRLGPAVLLAKGHERVLQCFAITAVGIANHHEPVAGNLPVLELAWNAFLKVTFSFMLRKGYPARETAAAACFPAEPS